MERAHIPISRYKSLNRGISNERYHSSCWVFFSTENLTNFRHWVFLHTHRLFHVTRSDGKQSPKVSFKGREAYRDRKQKVKEKVKGETTKIGSKIKEDKSGNKFGQY